MVLCCFTAQHDSCKGDKCSVSDVTKEGEHAVCALDVSQVWIHLVY